MNIHEYQAKAVLREFGVPVPRGVPAFSVDEAIKVLQNPLAILRSLLEMFVILTLTCTAGGALGAKILSKD